MTHPTAHPLPSVDSVHLGTVLQDHNNTHTCTRHCVFGKVCGNLYVCLTSQQPHVCDQMCTQRVWYDNHQTICRLSKRLFPHAAAELPDTEARKRGSDAESDEQHDGKRLAA